MKCRVFSVLVIEGAPAALWMGVPRQLGLLMEVAFFRPLGALKCGLERLTTLVIGGEPRLDCVIVRAKNSSL